MKMRKRDVDGSRDSEVDPYISARREWNERYGDYIAQARNWRLAAFAAFFVSAVLAAGLTVEVGQSKVVPYVVVVDKLGEVAAVRRADRATTPDDRVVKAQIASWLTDVRSVSSDPGSEKSALARAYALTSSGAVNILNQYFSKHSPFGQQQTVAVQINSVLPNGPHGFEIQWTETVRDFQGRLAATTQWVGRVTFEVDPPTDERGILANPLGLFITDVSWTEQHF